MSLQHHTGTMQSDFHIGNVNAQCLGSFVDVEFLDIPHEKDLAINVRKAFNCMLNQLSYFCSAHDL